MSLARAHSAVLRRLAGPEAGRCTAALRQPLLQPSASASASASASSSPSSARLSAPSFVQASGFCTSAARAGRRSRSRPRFTSVHAKEMGLVSDAKITAFADKSFPKYSASDRALLGQKFTPAQLAAIEAGEAAVDPRDLAMQGRLRDTLAEHGIDYYDDFSKMQPIVDRRIRDPKAATQTALDFAVMDQDAFEADLEDWLQSYTKGKDIDWRSLSMEEREQLAARLGPSDEDVLRYLAERPPLLHRDGKTRLTEAETGNSGMALGMPRQLPGDKNAAATYIDPDDEGLDEAGEYTELVKDTGLKVSDIFGLATKTVVVRRVSNQTRLGKIRSFSAIAIAGNGNGMLGLGTARGTEQSTARVKAKENAIRNMKPVPRFENRTIYGNMEVKISGTIVQLFSRPPGFGLRVPHRIFEMARAAGIHDLAAKIPRSRNPMNTVKATYQALMTQRDPEEIAIGRGKKLVDVRKVYYGGAVY